MKMKNKGNTKVETSENANKNKEIKTSTVLLIV